MYKTKIHRSSEEGNSISKKLEWKDRNQSSFSIQFCHLPGFYHPLHWHRSGSDKFLVLPSFIIIAIIH